MAEVVAGMVYASISPGVAAGAAVAAAPSLSGIGASAAGTTGERGGEIPSLMNIIRPESPAGIFPEGNRIPPGSGINPYTQVAQNNAYPNIGSASRNMLTPEEMGLPFTPSTGNVNTLRGLADNPNVGSGFRSRIDAARGAAGASSIYGTPAPAAATRGVGTGHQYAPTPESEFPDDWDATTGARLRERLKQPIGGAQQQFEMPQVTATPGVGTDPSAAASGTANISPFSRFSDTSGIGSASRNISTASDAGYLRPVPGPPMAGAVPFGQNPPLSGAGYTGGTPAPAPARVPNTVFLPGAVDPFPFTESLATAPPSFLEAGGARLCHSSPASAEGQQEVKPRINLEAMCHGLAPRQSGHMCQSLMDMIPMVVRQHCLGLALLGLISPIKLIIN